MTRALSMVLMACWIGAALITAASVAPAAFDVLPSRAMAGALVGRVLPAVFIGGVAVGVLAAFLTFRASRASGVTALVVAVSCAIAQFVISPRIARIRESVGAAIDTLAPDDPQRVAFGRLHGISVAWMGAAMLAALVFLILSLVAMRQPTGAIK